MIRWLFRRLPSQWQEKLANDWRDRQWHENTKGWIKLQEHLLQNPLFYRRIEKTETPELIAQTEDSDGNICQWFSDGTFEIGPNFNSQSESLNIDMSDFKGIINGSANMTNHKVLGSNGHITVFKPDNSSTKNCTPIVTDSSGTEVPKVS
jgi:hypothetical protein